MEPTAGSTSSTETEREPAEAVRELTDEYRPRWKAQGRYVDTLQLHLLAAFQRL